MNIEQAKKARELLTKIEHFEKSNLYKSVDHIIKANAPFYFGHDEFRHNDTGYSTFTTTKAFASQILTEEELSKIEEEYLYFIERVSKILEKKKQHMIFELAKIGL